MEERRKQPRGTGAVLDNPDPITGEPGSHPLGTGVGGATGAAAGAGIGAAVAGPVGAVVGGVVGAALGGAAGHAAGEAALPTDPAAEEAYWREHYASRPYHRSTSTYDDWAPAYRFGWESASRPEFRDRDFDAAEKELGRDWNRYKGTSRHGWEEAREAARDSWNRVRGTL